MIAIFFSLIPLPYLDLTISPHLYLPGLRVAIMNASMQSLAISLGVMQRNFHLNCPVLILTPHTCHFIVARKIPFDNPQVLDYVRIAYVASQAFALFVYYYTSSKVRPKYVQQLTLHLTCLR